MTTFQTNESTDVFGLENHLDYCISNKKFEVFSTIIYSERFIGIFYMYNDWNQWTLHYILGSGQVVIGLHISLPIEAGP